MMKNAVVLGSGSFGSSLAALLAQRGMKPTLWGRSEEVIAEINSKHTNLRYLPHIALPQEIEATTEMNCCAEAELVLFVLPSRSFRDVAEKFRDVGVPNNAILLSCTKGIELNTGSRMTEVLSDVFPENPVAVLSGPSHAEEVARSKATVSVIGCENEDIAQQLQDVFTLPWFRSYWSTDVAGIEIGGCVKNIAAIAGGIVEGMGLGDNAKAGLVTRGLAEMVRLGVAMGGKPETFSGLSGVGDLMATCYSDHSRNLRVGRMLGQGVPLDEIQTRLNMVAEGVPNTESVYHYAKKHGIRTPITDSLYEMLQGNIAPSEAAKQLLSRSPRPEVG
ncbi:MAG: NAD(P)H-dependent glycerol-3-phosphate dehydrogenase [Verrucomicrobiota bacterium]